MPELADIATMYLQEMSDPSTRPDAWRLRRMIADCRALLKKRPSPEVGMRLQSVIGQAHVWLEEFDQALDPLRIAVQMDRSDPNSHNNYGVALMRMEQHAAALEHFNEAIGLTATPEAIWLTNRAEALWHRGDHEAARAAIHAARAAVRQGNAPQLFVLAHAAAVARMSLLAAQLLGEFFAARHNIRPAPDPVALALNAPESWWRATIVTSVVFQALEEVRRGLPRELWDLSDEDEELSPDERAAIEQHRAAPHAERTTAAQMRARTESRV